MAAASAGKVIAPARHKRMIVMMLPYVFILSVLMQKKQATVITRNDIAAIHGLISFCARTEDVSRDEPNTAYAQVNIHPTISINIISFSVRSKKPSASKSVFILNNGTHCSDSNDDGNTREIQNNVANTNTKDTDPAITIGLRRLFSPCTEFGIHSGNNSRDTKPMKASPICGQTNAASFFTKG